MKPVDMHDMVLDGFSSKAKATQRCHVTHPVLKLGKGELYGGSCLHPVPGMDVYVGFNSHMADLRDGWVEPPPVRLHFPVNDHGVPQELDAYRKLITYLCNRLRAGAKVHMGCIGGHGRTGMAIAAIVAEMKVDKDPIEWVRKNYCKKAVESTSQVGFLVHHYKAKTAKPRDYGFTKVPSGKASAVPPYFGGSKTPDLWGDLHTTMMDVSGPQVYEALPGPRNIWEAGNCA